MEDGEVRPTRVKKERAETQPWQCEACTFINPSDFVSRCEICHTIRPRAASIVTKSTAAKVKRESGASPTSSRSNYVEISSDESEEEAYAPDARSHSPRRKLARVKKEDEDDAEYTPVPSPSPSDADGGVSSSDDELEQDPVERALKEEDSLLDAEDDDEDVMEEELLDERPRKRVLHDDFEEWRYAERVEAFRVHLAEEQARLAADPNADPNANLDVAFDGGFLLPAYIWNRLFAYQKTCIKWLWELHAQKVGGIIADEMGLGKTIQVIAFIAGLHYSAQHHAVNAPSTAASFRKMAPTLIIVPADRKSVV